MPINEWLTQIFDGRVSHTAKDVSAKIQSELIECSRCRRRSMFI